MALASEFAGVVLAAMGQARADLLRCPRRAGPHDAVLLGREDDDRYAWRCNQCQRELHSEERTARPTEFGELRSSPSVGEQP